jgi:fused signal recognition particle receptor
VILVVGVNGTGKTTSIGKLAWHLRKTLGLSVVVGAADTFRAAAVEQLERWASARASTSSRAPRARTPGRWPSTRSRVAASAVPTW